MAEGIAQLDTGLPSDPPDLPSPLMPRIFPVMAARCYSARWMIA